MIEGETGGESLSSGRSLVVPLYKWAYRMHPLQTHKPHPTTSIMISIVHPSGDAVEFLTARPARFIRKPFSDSDEQHN